MRTCCIAQGTLLSALWGPKFSVFQMFGIWALLTINKLPFLGQANS